ncbi:MAG: DinB family protein [Thermoguttaceae bacterium]|jgi:hypothetical protein
MIAEILRSNKLVLDYLRRLVADVPDDCMTRQFAGVINHPAWVIGHIIYSCQAIGGEIGIAAWLPDDWGLKFGTGSVPLDKPDTYPDKKMLLHALDDGQHRLETALSSALESDMKKPLPDVCNREIFPTVGHAVLHILTAHTAVHVGQLTVWRRASMLGPLTESFI